jgi:hypothetical protein
MVGVLMGEWVNGWVGMLRTAHGLEDCEVSVCVPLVPVV